MLRISPKAQASIEYMTIIALVVTGIVVMGPYVIRSINAHFKSLDDQVQDSHQENIGQTAQTNFPLPICDCSDTFELVGCNLASAANCPNGSTNRPCCSDYQSLWKRTCTPQNCDLVYPVGVTQECRPDAACCGEWGNTNCGTGINPPGCNNPPTSCCKNQMTQTRLCNFGNTTETQCILHGSCRFVCTATMPGFATQCPNDTNDLPNDIDWRLVGRTGGNCTTYVPANNGTATNRFANTGRGWVRVYAWGGGGAGAGQFRTNANGGTQSGGGGGGGGYVELEHRLHHNETYTIFVGTAGAPSATQATTNGVASTVTNTSEGTFLTAGGGTGRTNVVKTGGTGGTTSYVADPDIVLITRVSGSNGTASTPSSGTPPLNLNGGNGGNSGGGTIGTGGAGAPDQGTTNPPLNGGNGGAPGGGGGGGGEGRNVTAAQGDVARRTGGNGAAGRVTICTCTNERKCEAFCATGVPNAAGTFCIVPENRNFQIAVNTVFPQDNRSYNGVVNPKLCRSDTRVVTTITVTGTGCNRGNPSGATQGASCVATLW